MESRKEKSTSEHLLDLINPAPITFDPEDENDETTAKIVDKYDDDVSDEDNEISKFRKNIALLEEDDERYAGKKISRKALGSTFDEALIKIDSEDKSSDPSFGNSESDDEHTLQMSEDESDKSDDEGRGDDDDSGVDDDSYSINEKLPGVDLSGNDTLEENGSSFQHMSRQNVDADVEKGNAIRNQLNMWDNLLECRIQLQKCLLASNKMPQYNAFDEFKSNGGRDFVTLVEQSKKRTKKLLDKLIELRFSMLSSYSETKSSLHLKRKCSNDVSFEEMNEEIPSDSDMEANSEVCTQESPKEKVKPKKIRLDDYEKELDSQHKDYTKYRDTTIQKWNDKTRIASGTINSRNFSTFEQTTVKQIEQILSNRPRLIQRTRLKRSVYTVLGQELSTTQENGEGVTEDAQKVDDKTKMYDPEIFDDSDFYHQLLRELIERKSLNVTDSVQLGRQWIEIQKLRSKMKKKVDTKASKGRKIRYDVHPKLVNFMAPVIESPWNEEAKSELYNSLFGKKSIG